MASFMGKGAWWGVPVAVLIGIPMYSNAAGIIPIVSALLEKGAALGTVLAFMMAVIGLSFPETIILRKVLASPDCDVRRRRGRGHPHCRLPLQRLVLGKDAIDAIWNHFRGGPFAVCGSNPCGAARRDAGTVRTAPGRAGARAGELDSALKAGTWLIVEFGGEHCIPCMQMQPVLQDFQAALGSKAVVRNFWIQQHPDVAERFKSW